MAGIADVVVLFAIYRFGGKNPLHVGGALLAFQGLLVRYTAHTPGSFMLGFSIVDESRFITPKQGYPKPGLLACLLRALAFPLCALLIAPAAAYLNPHRRTPVDLLSGTRAVQADPRDDVPVARPTLFFGLAAGWLLALACVWLHLANQGRI